jgi:hypothetical protein
VNPYRVIVFWLDKIRDRFQVETPADRWSGWCFSDTLLDVDYFEAGSYSLGVRNYIFVSQPVLEELSKDENEAILAHEEAHVKNADALLSFLIPMLYLAIFTGKNAIYTVIDFRGREFKADKYAARRVGKRNYVAPWNPVQLVVTMTPAGSVFLRILPHSLGILTSTTPVKGYSECSLVPMLSHKLTPR